MSGGSQNDDVKVEGQGSSTDTPPDYEALARAQGWRPREDFKGDPSLFVDAETYYTRGITVWPIVKAENEALRAEIGRVRADAQEALRIAEKSREREVADLKVQHQEALLARRDAVKEADGEGFEAADKRAKELEKEIVEASRPTKTNQPQPLPPQYVAWLNQPEQQWLKDDPEALVIADAMAAMPRYNSLRGTNEGFWNAVAQDVKKKLKGNERSDLERPGPQGAGRGNGEVRTEAGKRSYGNLKPEFKNQCERQFKEFNPAGTLDSWKERYIKSVGDDAFRK